MKTFLKLTFYHELTIAKTVFTQKARTAVQSTKVKVTPDTTVMHACVCRLVEQKTALNVTCAMVHVIETQALIIKEINTHACML